MLKKNDLGIATQKFYGNWLSLVGQANIVFRRFAIEKNMPANKGQKVVMRYYDALEPALTALVEGVTPTGSTPVVQEVEISTDEYGDFISVSDQVGIWDEDGQLLKSPESKENVQLLSYQATETLDILVRNAIKAGTNVYYAGAPSISVRSNITSSNTVSRADYKRIIRTLQLQNVKPLAPMMATGSGQGSASLGPAYFGIIGPMTLDDLSDLDGWVDVDSYANPALAIQNSDGSIYEVGALRKLNGTSIRFLMTTNDLVFSAAGSSGINVYGDLIFGKEAYGQTTLKGRKTIKFLAKAPGTGGTDDPLDQRSTFGWKVETFGAGILKQVALMRYEHAVSG